MSLGYAFSLGLALLAACSSHEAQTQTDAATPEPCTPRLPPNPDSHEYSTDALPSGACDGSVAACTMAAREVCTCPGGGLSEGAYSGYECSCVASEWKCVVTSQGGSICFCGFDASVEASDATSDAH